MTTKFILIPVDLGFLFNDPLKLKPFLVIEHMKSKVKSLFAVKLNECIRQSSVTSIKYRKPSYYKSFKSKFEMVKRFVHLKDLSLRPRVAKFRCNVQALMIEEGWHKTLVMEDRTCTKVALVTLKTSSIC